MPTEKTTFNALSLANLIIRRQLKAPATHFKVTMCTCALFYIFAAVWPTSNNFPSNEIIVSAWLYAYLSASSAFYGVALLIIELRENGSTRSFTASKKSRTLFLYTVFLVHSFTSLIYFWVFYFATTPVFGHYDGEEFFDLTLRFYICFVMFCSMAIAFTFLPIDLKNSHTLLSICLFCMLVIGVMGAGRADRVANAINRLNPLAIAHQIMSTDLPVNTYSIVLIVSIFLTASLALFKYLRTHPTSERY